MSDSANPSPAPLSPSTARPKAVSPEIRIYSHSSLFYWWPVWFFGFLFALWTFVDNDRLVIVGHKSIIKKGVAEQDQREILTIQVDADEDVKKRLLSDSEKVPDHPDQYAPKL